MTHIELTKGDYSPQPGIKFGLQDFSADQIARGKSSPLCFVRLTEIQHGDVFIDAQSLTREFETKATQSGSSIHDLRVELKEHVADLKGTIKKVIPISFTMEGPLSTDGKVLIFQAKSIKAEGLPVKGLLDTLGKHLDTLLQSESIGGVSVKNDTIIFEPEKIAHVRGKIASTDVNPNGLIVKFVAEPPKQDTSKTASQKHQSRPAGRPYKKKT